MDALRPEDQKILRKSGSGEDVEITYTMDTSKRTYRRKLLFNLKRLLGENKGRLASEKISERDRFEFPANTIFAHNLKIIDWRAIYDAYFCSKKENGPKTESRNG